MVRLPLAVDPPLGDVRLGVGEQVLLVVVDKGAHPDGRAPGHDVVEAAVVVDEILVTGHARQTSGDHQSDTEGLPDDAVEVGVLLQLDPAQIARVLVLELLPETRELLGLV